MTPERFAGDKLASAKALGVDASLMFSNVSKYGNTSSASMLIAASEWQPSPGPVVFAGFGAGFNWGALVALLRQ